MIWVFRFGISTHLTCGRVGPTAIAVASTSCRAVLSLSIRGREGREYDENEQNTHVCFDDTTFFPSTSIMDALRPVVDVATEVRHHL
jgi:hypothetical protein